MKEEREVDTETQLPQPRPVSPIPYPVPYSDGWCKLYGLTMEDTYSLDQWQIAFEDTYSEEEEVDTETLLRQPRPVSPLPYPVPYSDEWCKLYGLTMEDTYSLDQWEVAVEDTYSEEEEEEDPEEDLVKEAARFSQTDSLYGESDGEFQIEEEPIPEVAVEDTVSYEEDPEEDLEEWERLSETDSTETYGKFAVEDRVSDEEKEDPEEDLEECERISETDYTETYGKFAIDYNGDSDLEEFEDFSMDHNGFGPLTPDEESHIILANDSGTHGKRKRKTTDDGIQDAGKKISEVQWVRNNRRRLSRVELTNGKRKRKTTTDARTKISEVGWVRNHRRRLSRV